MTAIAAVLGPEGAALAADSRLSTDAGHAYDTPAPKIWRAGARLVGAAGSVDYCEALARVAWPADLRSPTATDAVRRALARTGAGLDEGEGIIVEARKIWLVDASLVALRTHLAAVGSGAPYALGALVVTSHLDPAARARAAVRAAAKWRPSDVGGRTIVLELAWL